MDPSKPNDPNSTQENKKTHTMATRSSGSRRTGGGVANAQTEAAGGDMIGARRSRASRGSRGSGTTRTAPTSSQLSAPDPRGVANAQTEAAGGEGIVTRRSLRLRASAAASGTSSGMSAVDFHTSPSASGTSTGTVGTTADPEATSGGHRQTMTAPGSEASGTPFQARNPAETSTKPESTEADSGDGAGGSGTRQGTKRQAEAAESADAKRLRASAEPGSTEAVPEPVGQAAALDVGSGTTGISPRVAAEPGSTEAVPEPEGRADAAEDDEGEMNAETADDAGVGDEDNAEAAAEAPETPETPETPESPETPAASRIVAIINAVRSSLWKK